MLRLVYLLAALGIILLTAGDAVAQEAHLGVRLGRAFSSFSGGGAHFVTTSNFLRHDVYERSGGLEGMGFLQIPVSQAIGLQWEIGYGGRGARQILLDGSERNGTNEYHFGYIQTALLLRFEIVEGPRARLALHGGPYGGYLIASKAEIWRPRIEGGRTVGDIDSLQDFDAGLVIGMDMDFSRRLVLDARFSLGMKDFVEARKLGDFARSQHTSLSNTAFVLSFGVMI